MDTGTLLKVNGRLATTVGPTYTRMVYDAQDYTLSAHGYEGGSACSYVDVVFADNSKTVAVNLSRSSWQTVS